MEVWANSAGAWFTASIWYYWDEQTQTAQPYGQIPQVGDYVYLNGYTIQFNASNPINIGNGTITNKRNPHTNRQGGFLQATSGPWSITANLEVYNSYISADTAGVMKYVIGNIYIDQTVATSAFYKTGGSVSALNVVGNIDAYAPLYHDTATTYSLSITGELHYHNISSFPKNPTTATIVGRLIMDYCVFACTTLNLNGSVEYKSNRNDVGIRYTTLNILNHATFTWRDMTEPRSNPFIILTDAEMNNRQQYPPEDEVKEGTEYVWGQKVGTYLPDYPPESVVLQGYIYDNGDKTGSMSAQAQVGCVTKEDVREGVALIGMGEVGTLVVPSVDDVREGVIFDNGSVGTLIVQGGGERLRIADFGYYTRSTSITYIVDLTESDKPAFADCEEIVLRSLFPTLDLDNIPDKFFDDLFVQFLRYRLLVEYYRGTSINSKFTPSEPTAEIVNYANSKCEYWLNTANLFLQLWGEKYPNSVKKDRILL